jgi:hypothetical protein
MLEREKKMANCKGCEEHDIYVALVDRGDRWFCWNCGRITPKEEEPEYKSVYYRFPTSI